MHDDELQRDKRIDRLLAATLALPTHEREAFLDEQCVDDPELRRTIATLMQHAGTDATELETGAPLRGSMGRLLVSHDAAGGGKAHRIESYKLLRKLGEGGMGQVWEAEQSQPVRRRVAIKIIKAGMDSRQVIGRFEAERQALALMDHPAIAKVFDAGVASDGRPFFAMELVRGEPIDRFCDQHRLTTRERLDLILQVCEGIEHAHQKGIIHRDLKPSNLLVSLRGETPEVKIIDFGVAKATQHRLTEATMVTELGALIGTPEYMSPEQAELTGLDVDTRTDVYAMGVILYQLLVGVLPFETSMLRRAGFDEIRRVIREEEPSKPSKRVSTLGDDSHQAARLRRTDFSTLQRQLRGDLDWITMKALEKDRRRRYSSATELGADIRRHLHDEPVLASPPSTAYRARKFVRRHRLGVTAAAVILLAMLAGLGAATWGLVRARQAEVLSRQEAATAERVIRFMTSMFESSTPRVAQGRDITVREVLDRGAGRIREELRDEPQVRARMLDAVGKVYTDIGLYDEAEPLLEEARTNLGEMLGEEAPETLAARSNLAWLRLVQGRLDDAEHSMAAVLEAQRRVRGEDHPTTLGTAGTLGRIYMDQGRYDEAEPLLEAALEGTRRVLGDGHGDTVRSMLMLCWLYARQGRADEAEELNARAYDIAKRTWGDDAPLTLDAQREVGYSLMSRGRYEEAERVLLDSLEKELQVFDEDHRITLYTVEALARLYENQGRYAEAEEYRTRLLAGRRRAQGPEHFETIQAMNGLAFLKRNRDNHAEAEALAREALETGRRVLGEEHPATRGAMNNLAVVLLDQGEHEAAAERFRELLEINRRVLGDDHPGVLMVMNNLAIAYGAMGRHAETVPLLEEALEIHRRDRGDERTGTLTAMSNLASAYLSVGRVDDAEALLREALETHRRVIGNADETLLYLLVNLAQVCDESGRSEEAVPFAEEAVEQARRILGKEASFTASAEVTLAQVYSHVGRTDEAAKLSTAGLSVLVDALGSEHTYSLDARRVLAETRARQGRFREAEQLFDQVIEAQSRVLGEDHPELMTTFYSRALLSAAREEWEEALDFLRRAVEGGWAQRRIYDEPALAPLRGDAAFTEIVATVREKTGEQAVAQKTSAARSP